MHLQVIGRLALENKIKSIAITASLALMLVVSFQSFASNETPGFSPEQRDLFKEISKDLRCPTCTGLSIYESDAEFSVQIKDAVKEQVAKGKSREEIMAFFIDRYGNWILREPPKKGFHILAWAVPIGILLGGPVLIWLFVWRRRKELPTFGVRPAREIINEMESQIAKLKGA